MFISDLKGHIGRTDNLCYPIDADPVGKPKQLIWFQALVVRLIIVADEVVYSRENSLEDKDSIKTRDKY